MPALRHAPPPEAPTHYGAGPYRDAPLSLPRRPSAPRRGVGLLGAAVVTFGLVRALHRPTETPAAAQPVPLFLDGATSLAGGARITAVLHPHDSSYTEVWRIPGAGVRHGDDTVAAPRPIAAHGAVTVVPGGEHFVDARGELLRFHEGVLQPLAGAEVAPSVADAELPADARVVQRAGRFARMSNDALLVLPEVPYGGAVRAFPGGVRDVAADGELVCALRRDDQVTCARAGEWHSDTGPNSEGAAAHLGWRQVPTLSGYRAEQVIVGHHVACVRDREGLVRCARFESQCLGGWYPLGILPPRAIPWVGEAPIAASVAISRDDLCVLGVDRHLRCVHGPAEDAGAPLVQTPLRLRDAMDGVDEVALTMDLGCARRGGRIDCWGPLARGGWVTRRERPVRVAGLRDVSSLVASDGLVCALARGVVRCWGVGPEGMRRPVPIQVTLPAAAERIEHTARDGACARLAGRRTLCWRDVGEGANPRHAPQPPLPLAAVPLRAAVDPASSEPPPQRIAGLDDVVQVARAAGGLACARRRGGDVWCWGDNASGALTVAEADRSPRVVTLRR